MSRGDNGAITVHPETPRMLASTNQPMGLFIVRAWIEGGDPKGFRARISQALRDGEPEVLTVVSSPKELSEKSRWWAEEFIATHT